VAVNDSISGFLVINICNHGEHYETPRIFGDVAGGQKIIGLTLASVYRIGSALEIFFQLGSNFDY
jgi:hypothetical protein